MGNSLPLSASQRNRLRDGNSGAHLAGLMCSGRTRETPMHPGAVGHSEQGPGRARLGRRRWADFGRLALLPALPAPPPIQAAEAGTGKGGEPLQGSAAPGRGALWERAEGSLRAQLQTLPTSGAALVFICHVHCDLFPVRSGLNKGSAAEKRFKTTKPALAFTGLIKKVDSREGNWPAPASQAHVRGDARVGPVLLGVSSSLVIKSARKDARVPI